MKDDIITLCRVLFEVTKMIFGILLFLVFQGICFIITFCFDFANKLYVKIFGGLKL